MTPEERAWAITEKYYRVYFRNLLAYICRQCPKMYRDDLKGCLTETFFDLYRSILRDVPDALRGLEVEDCLEDSIQMVVCKWLRTAVEYRSFAFFKRHRKYVLVEDVSIYSSMVDPTSAESLAEQAETKSLVSEACSTLEETEQSVIHGIYFDKLKQREVAEDLGIPQGTVSTVHRRSLSKLHQKLKGSFGNDPDFHPNDNTPGDDHEST